jgi:WD40 repeat protein
VAVVAREEAATLSGPTGMPNAVWDVAFSPDGRYLASASGDFTKYMTHGGPGEVKLWDVRSPNSRSDTYQCSLPLQCGVQWKRSVLLCERRHLSPGQ